MINNFPDIVKFYFDTLVDFLSSDIMMYGVGLIFLLVTCKILKNLCDL